MPKASAPTVNGLIVARIDDLQASLTTQIHDLKIDLGARIQSVDERVQTQNSRIGKCETKLADIATTERVTRRFSSKQMAGGLLAVALGSPVLIKVAELVFTALRGTP